jgi:acyl-CoA dehydrogenase
VGLLVSPTTVVMLMNLDLPSDLKQIQQSTRELVDSLLGFEPEFHNTGKVPAGVHEGFKELGLFGVAIPEAFGGLDLGVFATAVIQSELGRLPPQFWGALRVLMGPGSKAIVAHGTDAQKRKWLPRIAQGDCTVAFALTESEAGSDVARMTTKAERREDGYVINGGKSMISNAQRADVLMVFAYTDRSAGLNGISAFLMEPDTPGFQVTGIIPTMGASLGGLTEIVFEDCRVPHDNLIGKEGMGFRYAMESLNEGRLNVGATGVGMGDLALEQSVGYAKQRIAFGKPIADFQSIQHMLADMAVDMHAARQLLYEAAWLVDQGRGSAAKCSMVKLFCSEACFRTADRAVQIYGGAGYCRGVIVERIFRDARALRIYEGTSEIQRNLIAKALLRE